MVYGLDYKQLVLYVLPIKNIVLSVRDSPAPGDHTLGSGDGCWMLNVNSWALGWSSDMLLPCNTWTRNKLLHGERFHVNCLTDLGHDIIFNTCHMCIPVDSPCSITEAYHMGQTSRSGAAWTGSSG